MNLSPAVEERFRALFEWADDARGSTTGSGFSVGTTRGPVRSENQDRAFVAHVVQGGVRPRELVVAAVFDGMGGMTSGGAAAGLAAASFLADLVGSGGPVASRLEQAVARANHAVFERFKGRGGTTLTCVAFGDPRVAHFTHVGDSRLYVSTGPGALELLTEDQTLSKAVMGSLVAEEDELDNRLLQFVGIGPYLEPTYGKRTDELDSTWLLTTDGAHAFGRKSLQGILRDQPACGIAVRRLLSAAEAFGTEDNATIVALRPSQFRIDRALSDGTSVTVWMPERQIELWFDVGESAQRLVDPKPPAMKVSRPPRSEADKPKTLRSTKRKPAGGRKTAAKAKGDLGDLGEAERVDQLKITFGDEQSEDS